MRHAPGFTLVEMAVVLVIIGLILGGLLVPLSAQMEMRGYQETSNRLEEAKEALLGFAMAHGRLPCPASATSLGIEDPVGGGNCNHDYDGYLPAATLGLSNLDGSGYALDGWGSLPVNRVRYAVSTSNSNAFTTSDGMRTTSLGSLSPDLKVCASGSGVTAASCGTAISLTSTAVAVVFSAGKNAATGGTGTDEAKNYDNNQVFVSHQPSPGANEFDDVLTWLSPGILYNRMVSAGRLP